MPDDVDLLVMGGPTHAFSMSRASTRHDAEAEGAPAGHAERGIREWLGELPASERVEVATFDTRVVSMRHLPGSAAKPAGKEVRRHHLGRLVATENFYVNDMDGPLLDGELDRARTRGRSLAKRRAEALTAVSTSGVRSVRKRDGRPAGPPVGRVQPRRVDQACDGVAEAPGPAMAAVGAGPAVRWRSRCARCS